MDTRSLCLFLLVGSLIQINDATPSPMVIIIYTPKFLSLSVKIAAAVGNGTEQILRTQTHIRQLVNSAEKKVHKQVFDLDKLISQSKFNAFKSGANITSCINNEQNGIKHIHMNIMEKCRLQDGVKHLYVYSLKLAKEELSLSVAVKWCIAKYPIDGIKLKTCFDEKIADVENKIAKFQTEISTTIPEALEYSDSCTAKYLEALGMAIHKVSCIFKDCVDTIIPQTVAN